MKYILIAILTISATAQAKPFTMSDWKKTLPTPQKVEVKQGRTLSQKKEGAEGAIIKLMVERTRWVERKAGISQQLAKSRTRLSKMEGDTSKGVESAIRDRNTRSRGIDNSIARIDTKIKGYRSAISYYTKLERNRRELDKIEKEGLILRARGFIS